jgi:hypothetical protein
MNLWLLLKVGKLKERVDEMTIDELYSLKKRLMYKGKPCIEYRLCNPRNYYRPCPEGYLYESIWVEAICVEDGRKTKIESGGLISFHEIKEVTLSSKMSHIRETLTMLELHEVSECMILDGKRIYNPHDTPGINTHVQPELDLSLVADYIEQEEEVA